MTDYRNPWDAPERETAAERRWRRLAGKPRTFYREPLAPEVSDYGRIERTARGYAAKGRGWLGARAGDECEEKHE